MLRGREEGPSLYNAHRYEPFKEDGQIRPPLIESFDRRTLPGQIARRLNAPLDYGFYQVSIILSYVLYQVLGDALRLGHGLTQ